jgi:hypothetical protein
MNKLPLPRFLNVQSQFVPVNEVWLLIGDYRWYNDYEAEIEDWCKSAMDRGYHREGMIIKFATEEDCTVFLMRWSND